MKTTLTDNDRKLMIEVRDEWISQITEHPRIQSYVADKYFVSTIWRESSALDGGWYYETIVWKWDKTTKKTGEMLYMSSSLRSHFECCKKLLEGKPLEEEEA